MKRKHDKIDCIKWFSLKFMQPWTEHRRKFWRQALGDRYESPSQCYNENTQFVKFCDENLQKHLADESFTEALEDDEHIKKLNYLINNRPTDSDENDEKMNMLPETAPTMSDIGIISSYFH